MGVSLVEFSKALDSLNETLVLQKSAKLETEKKAFRDACIQRFEYCVELSWKLSMKALGSTVSAAKPAIREMARNNLVLDANRWLDFIEARNSSSHSYDEETAQKVFSEILAFYPLARALQLELEKISK